MRSREFIGDDKEIVEQNLRPNFRFSLDIDLYLPGFTGGSRDENLRWRVKKPYISYNLHYTAPPIKFSLSLKKTFKYKLLRKLVYEYYHVFDEHPKCILLSIEWKKGHNGIEM